MTDVQNQLRDKDKAVLRNIADGNNDVQKITANTTLENHHVTYAFQKLEELELLEISKPDGNVERIINGQKRVFQHPKQAELTNEGETAVDTLDEDSGSHYNDLTHKELVQKLNQLEARIDSLDRALDTFKDQIQQKL
ncbi:hypothetical protein GRX01_01740 [Halobaculum sp. WSA2]|uniref:Uncharacterized protein n=1 Tax=Halobaculum saliterrae TaxID=2073113 RepID=A0A6B0STZ8_9EURY|nr:hypothetical protein [Halobaculum saliterrae]MXR40083.1 hypothetical protein [Halobaculum saliterrae]